MKYVMMSCGTSKEKDWDNYYFWDGSKWLNNPNKALIYECCGKLIMAK